LPCFNGIAFFGTGQIKKPNTGYSEGSGYGAKFFVLDFGDNYIKDFVDEDTCEVVAIKKDRFIFLTVNTEKIRDNDKIIGHVECSSEYTEGRKEKLVYVIKFIPKIEFISEVKTEEIFLILESFKKRFEIKQKTKEPTFTESLSKIKKFCEDKTLTDDEVKSLFFNLKFNDKTTTDEMLEYSKILQELRPNVANSQIF